MGNFSSERTMLRYVDPDTNSNKFYEITAVDMGRAGALVIKRWGRYTSMHATTGGQSQVEWHDNYYAAQSSAAATEHKKRQKGYNYHGKHESLDIPDHVVRAFWSDTPTVGVPVFTSVAEAEAWLDAHASIGV